MTKVPPAYLEHALPWEAARLRDLDEAIQALRKKRDKLMRRIHERRMRRVRKEREAA